MQALSTVFNAPPWCTNRFAVYIDDQGPGTSTLNPTSGWVDRLFTDCVPTQYTTKCPTFSPGVCPSHMQIVAPTSNVYGTKTVWTGGCCQSGFTTIDYEPRFLCTSTISTPMAFLLEPNVSTTDIYTTLSASNLMIEHDQMTVQWESSDLPKFPLEVAKSYATIMGLELTPATHTPGPIIPHRLTIPEATQALLNDLPASIWLPTTPFQLTTGTPVSGPLTPTMTSNFSASSTISNSAGCLSPLGRLILAGSVGLVWMLY